MSSTESCTETFGFKVCVLPAEHKGLHKAQGGTVWGPAMSSPEPCSCQPQCPHCAAAIEEADKWKRHADSVVVDAFHEEMVGLFDKAVERWAQEERERIIKWLRSPECDIAIIDRMPVTLRDAVRAAADAIERGEHNE